HWIECVVFGYIMALCKCNRELFDSILLAVKKQIISSLLSITAKILYIVLILIISLDVRTLMIIYIISHASVIFYVLGINRNDIGRFEFDKGWFKKVLNFS